MKLVRAQLRRAIERYGSSMNSRKMMSKMMSFHGLPQSFVENGKWVYLENTTKMIDNVPKTLSAAESAEKPTIRKAQSLGNISSVMPLLCSSNVINVNGHDDDDNKKPDATAIPDDFICPISLELMRDPVIVATGQVYMIKMVPLVYLFCFLEFKIPALILIV